MGRVIGGIVVAGDLTEVQSVGSGLVISIIDVHIVDPGITIL